MTDPIKLTITVSDKQPEKPNFGVPLIAGKHTRFADLIREYGEAGDMLDDGFLASDAEYQKALILKSQNPAIESFKVGRLLDTTFNQIVNLTPTNVTAGLEYFGTIAEEDFSFEVQPSDALLDICGDLATEVGAITGVTPTDNATDVDVATDTADTLVSYAGLTEHLAVEDTTTVVGADLQSDLDAILDEDPGWYGLSLTINSADAIKAAAAWTEANKKLYIPMSADSGIADVGVTDDVASDLLALSYTRTGGIFHRDIGGSEWADMAFLAVNLSPEPGSYTPAYKSLAGVSVDSLRAGQLSGIEAKNWTHYTRQYSNNVTYQGQSASGRFLDVTRFVDWLDFTIRQDAFLLLVNNPKLPYTNAGIESVKNSVEGSILKGVTAGGIDGESPITVTAPTIAETSAGDRAARVLKNIRFSCRLTGALHGLEITGTVSV